MGRTFRPSYTVKRPDGSKERRRTAWYHVDWTDALGRTRRQKAAPTQDLAREVLRQKETETSQELHGLPTQNARGISVADLRDRYLAFQASRSTATHHHILKQRIGIVLAGTKAVTVRDLTPDKVDAFLTTLEEGLTPPSPQVLNRYLKAVKGMLNWAVRMRMLPFNPLAPLSFRPEIEKRRNRRPLTEKELGRLFEAARVGPLVREAVKRTGTPLPEEDQERWEILRDIQERVERGEIAIPLDQRAALLGRGERNALVYRLLTYTGLRLGELRALRWGDLDLTARTLTVRAETAKNRRAAVLDLPDWFAAHLETLNVSIGASDASPVVDVPSNILRQFNGDLELARIPKEDDRGRTADLHGLRHTYGTLLIKNGADIKTVQTLMRHSAPGLTLGIYVHHDRGRLKEAVAALPRIGSTAPTAGSQVALRDGTTGQSVDISGDQTPTFRQGESGRTLNPFALNEFSGSDSTPPEPKVVGSTPTGRARFPRERETADQSRTGYGTNATALAPRRERFRGPDGAGPVRT